MRSLLFLFLLIQIAVFGQNKKPKTIPINIQQLKDTSIYISDPDFRIYFDKKITLNIIDTSIQAKGIHPNILFGLQCTRDYIINNIKAEFLNVNLFADFNLERLTSKDSAVVAVVTVFSEISNEMIKRGLCYITRNGIPVKKYYKSSWHSNSGLHCTQYELEDKTPLFRAMPYIWVD